MIHYLATLSVKKIVPAVIATVPNKNKVKKINETGGDGVFVVCSQGPTQCVCVTDCYFIVNVLDLPFASSIMIYR